MDYKQYKEKITAYMSSEASPEIKAEAIKKLKDEYYGVKARAMKLINDSSPDYSDIGKN